MEHVETKKALRLHKREFENVMVKQDNISFCQFHKHDYIEVVYFYKGTGEHIVDSDKYDVKSGDLFLIPCGVAHKFYGNNLCKINIMFDSAIIDKRIRASNFILDFGKYVFKSDEVMDKLKEKKYIYIPNFSCEDNKIDSFNILQEYNARDIGCEHMILCKVKIFLIDLFRKYVESNRKINIKSTHKKTVGKALIYIDGHICEIKKSSDVARQVGYNAVYFNRIFTEQMGISLSCYFRERKMEYACKLLVETDYTIEKICEIIGYNDLKNFYKSFKCTMNSTPSEYRNAGRK